MKKDAATYDLLASDDEMADKAFAESQRGACQRCRTRVVYRAHCPFCGSHEHRMAAWVGPGPFCR